MIFFKVHLQKVYIETHNREMGWMGWQELGGMYWLRAMGSGTC
jgi:hypothetical protein